MVAARLRATSRRWRESVGVALGLLFSHPYAIFLPTPGRGHLRHYRHDDESVRRR